jgi:ABC-2 type transport system ATP-binding protein
MIQVQDLVKWYGPTLAVDHVSFQIAPGQVVGFLGPNGAGKSTALRILTGFIPPTSGSAVVAGHDVFRESELARRQIGYLPESNPLYPEMRVEEYLHFRGKLQGMAGAARRKAIDRVCERCALGAVRRRLVGRLSRGNRQRVGLAQALLHDPPVLILDEPTAGLDPNQITHFRELLAELRGRHTILVSTHILPEIERCADHVLIIAGGRIVAQGSPDELRRKVGAEARLRIEVQAKPETVQQALAQASGVAGVETSAVGDWCRAVVSPQDGREIRDELGRLIAARGWAVREMRYDSVGLEQFFVQITAAQDQGDRGSTGPAPSN